MATFEQFQSKTRVRQQTVRHIINSTWWYDAGGEGNCGPLTIASLLKFYLPSFSSITHVSLRDMVNRVRVQRKMKSKTNGEWWTSDDFDIVAQLAQVRITVFQYTTAQNLKAGGTTLQTYGSPTATPVLYVINHANVHWFPTFPRKLNDFEKRRFGVVELPPVNRTLRIEFPVDPRSAKAQYQDYLDNAKTPIDLTSDKPIAKSKKPNKVTKVKPKEKSSKPATPKPVKKITQARKTTVSKPPPQVQCPEGYYYRRGYTIVMPAGCVKRPIRKALKKK
jgi:hypothetical protein